MSDDGFLKRWSRKKRTEEPPPNDSTAESPPSNLPPQAGEGFHAAGEATAVPPPRSGGGQEGVAPQTKPPSEDEQEIDPATLPPIESLGADSDYTVFMKKGVPEALRIAALRKAWAADPFIRDFRSPAIEYGWDFTTPEYDLRATDDVAKLLDQIFPPKPKLDAEAAAAEAAPKPEIDPPVASAPAPRSIAAPAHKASLPQDQLAQAEPARPAKEPEREPLPPRRKHGGALPD